MYAECEQLSITVIAAEDVKQYDCILDFNAREDIVPQIVAGVSHMDGMVCILTTAKRLFGKNYGSRIYRVDSRIYAETHGDN